MYLMQNITGWPISFSYKHCTKCVTSTFQLLHVSASIIPGSAIGPISYDINASDLFTVILGNLMYKYAANSYLVIPASNV